MAIHLPIGPLKTRSGLEPVPRYESSTYQLLADDITTAPYNIILRCLRITRLDLSKEYR